MESIEAGSDENLEQVVLYELEEYKLNYNEVFKEPEIVVGVLQGDDYIPVFTKGNFSVVIGKPKTRKSTLLSIITAAFLKGTDGLGNISSESENNKALWIDTEQNGYHLRNAVENIFLLAPDSKERLITYRFRNMDPGDRFTNAKHLIEYYTRQGVSLIVLDGVADLLTVGYNDETEAIQKSNYLLKATEVRNCHIVTVLHENKANSMAKGHIGSYLNQKAETVLRVTKDSKDPNRSEVKAQFTRNREFESFFVSHKDGLPCIEANGSNEKKPKFDFDVIDIKNHLQFLEEFYQKLGKEKALRSELTKAMHSPNCVFDKGVSQHAAKKWLKRLMELNLLRQDPLLQNAPYFLNQ